MATELFGLRFGRDDRRGQFIETRAGRTLFSSGATIGWLGRVVQEPFRGAWQRNREIRVQDCVDHFAIYACISRICSDIGKCPAIVKQYMPSGVLKRVDVPLYSNVLRRPNRYQNWAQFIERWMFSKLTRGNAVVFKQRDASGRVRAMHVMDYDRVQVKVSPDGDVWYDYQSSELEGRDAQRIILPASDVIHDRCPVPLGNHPLIGVSPLAAACLAAGMGEQALVHVSRLFFSGRPGGVLKVPKHISREQAELMQRHYQERLVADGSNGLFVISDGMDFKEMTPTAQDNLSQQSIRLSADIVCAAFGVPKYFVLGVEPAASAIEPEIQRYFSQCLQTHVESIENLLDEALEVDVRRYSVELDLSYLFRMDSRNRWEVHKAAISCGAMTPNEVRHAEDLEPVEGGDACYLQQQNYSLAALAKRDAKEDPFGSSSSNRNQDNPNQDPDQDQGQNQEQDPEEEV